MFTILFTSNCFGNILFKLCSQLKVYKMSLPLFPKCLPKMTDRAWFDVDHPCAHEDEVALLEKEHQDWVEAITKTHSDLPPIGKTSPEIVGDDDDEEEDDNDDDDDDDSESHDDEEEDEIEMDAAN